MLSLKTRLSAVALPLYLLLAPFTQASEEAPLPKTLAWTAYPTNSSSYAQVVAIGSMLQSNHSVSVRILPADNDVLRMTPLKSGRVDLCSCGIASYFGAEGVLMFADANWGPQPIRVLAASSGGFGLAMATAGDLGVETPADLAGKRIAYIRGDDAVNKGTEAMLAYGGLTWNDVERIDFPGHSRAFDAIIAGQADATFSSTLAPPAVRLASSPRGITWPVLDPQEQEAWERVKAVAPYFSPHQVTAAAGDDVSADRPMDSAAYPYPILVANADFDDAVAYRLVQAMQDHLDEYQDAAPGADGYALEKQKLAWVIPLHDGVVDHYRDIGVWNDELQAHQEYLVERQNTLLSTWNHFMDGETPEDRDEFRNAWMQARAEGLRSAGYDPVFE
ncbi:TAXI family TRAP transporter solute-binding subunit [Vreelandella zhaodongensis]|uniref:TAXI family TRAP transporter solute-binding subunit n=1 Tax=Vreelandella zhaodongensis TaxID=1176240 RepID=A0ABX2SWS4_VREZH|nr:TAXI family TRAP transporter solute-binding subunit [Halomonas zhaodongensis]NYS46003.1 TAXI family TRAP transporter solute-binding subunit [Halomonas zhaodongensis]